MMAIKQFLEEVAVLRTATSTPTGQEPMPEKGEQLTSTVTAKVDKKLFADVKRYVDVLKRDKIDITAKYSQWIRVAFALANSFGEDGRESFHSISSAGYPKYDQAETDTLYTNCLSNLRGPGKTKNSAKSIIRFATEAGVRIRRKEKNDDKDNDYLLAFNVIQDKYPAVFDSLNQDVLVNGKPLNDEIINTIHVDLLVNYEFFVSKEFIQTVLESSFIDRVNHFDDFVLTNQHKMKLNGTIDKLASCIKTRTGLRLGFDYKREMIMLFMVKMIAQLYEDIPNDLCLILLGEPYIGKTMFFKNLLPEELRHLFSVQSFKADKDGKRDASKYLLILDDEFRGLKMATSEALKSQLSLTTINLRVPYGRKPHPFKRIASYCAVSNERFILKDPTGNRRLICFWVESIDWDLYNSIDKGELLMEAYAHYIAGYNHSLSAELLNAIKAVSREFEISSSAEEVLITYYASAKIDEPDAVWRPVSEIIRDARKTLGVTLTDYEVGKALRKHNYQHKFMNVNNSKLLCWCIRETKPNQADFKSQSEFF
jgi:predicted P-loop ATPase